MFVGLTAIAVSVGTLSVAAQGRNFSGTWVVDSEKTMAAMAAAGGGGTMTAAGGGGGAVVARSGGGGGRGGGMASAGSTDTVISLDGTAFSLETGGVKTVYPLNGTEVLVEVRGVTGKGQAAWQGDVLTITTTLDSPNGPVTSSTKWSMEGDSLVRETARKAYYKRK
jgi:hypothetical protein